MTTTSNIKGQLQDAKSETDIHNALLSVAHLIKYEFFLLGMLMPISATSSELFKIDNYPEAWRDHYAEQKYLHKDPALHYAMANYLPIDWQCLLKQGGLKSEGREVLLQAKKFGLNAGFCVPIHGALGQFGVINFATESLENSLDHQLTKAISVTQLLVPTLQEAIKRICCNQLTSAASFLTKREVECLVWATEGKSSWEISRILGCSEHTATFHLKNASTKLGASNRYQAISKAMLSGIIQPAFG